MQLTGLDLCEMLEQLRSQPVASSNEAPERVEQFRSDVTAQMVILYFGDILDLHSHEAHVLNRVSDRPRASRLARIQASNNEFVANQWHETRYRDAFTCAVLQRLDGSVDRDMLTEDIEAALQREKVSLPADWSTDRPLVELIDKTLETLRREAILIA